MPSYAFLPEKVKKDMTQKFSEYCNAKNKEFFIASNNEDYANVYRKNQNIMEISCIPALSAFTLLPGIGFAPSPSHDCQQYQNRKDLKIP